MPHSFRRLVLPTVVLTLVACSDRATELPVQPGRPSSAQLPPDRAALEAQINTLINALYAPAAQGRVFSSFARIKAAIASGRTTDAQTAIVAFFKATLADLRNGDLLDPNGTQPPSLADAVRDLLNGVAQFGGLAAPIPESNPFGGDGAVGVIGSSGGTLVSSSGFGGVSFPAGALPGDVIVVVSRLPNPTQTGSGPLPTSQPQYPLFYDFSTTPPVMQFAQPVTVGICQLEVGEPFGPPTQAVADRLQLAHPNPSNPTTVELLQRVDASFVNCSGVSLASVESRDESRAFAARARAAIMGAGSRLLSLVRPTPAYAVHGGLGGLTSSFSPFGAVDPGIAIVGVCSTPMAGVSATYPTITQAISNVAVGGVIKLCPETITLSSSITVTKPMTIEGSVPATPTPLVVTGASLVGFVVAPAVQGSVTFRSLAFTLNAGASSAIDLGTGQAPAPVGSWWQVLIERSTFTMPNGVGRAVRAFQTIHANPKLTFQLNQVTGGTFPVVTLTNSSTSDIEVLSNSFGGGASVAEVLLQNEAFARVSGNVFTSCGTTAACVSVLNVASASITSNTFSIPSSTFTGAGILVSGNSSASISSNVILGGGLTGSAADSLSYRYRSGGIVVASQTASPGTSFGNAGSTANTTATVSHNTITSAANGIRLVGGGVNLAASDNSVTNSLSPVQLINATSTASTLTATTNDFTTYFTPIRFSWPNATPSTITATCNWWGSASGPVNVAVGTPASMYVPFATAPTANGAGGQCNGTAAASSSDGVYVSAKMLGPDTHVDRVIVAGRTAVGHHEFANTDGTAGGSADWTGTITPSALTPTTGTITGGGSRFASCCGTVAFTLTSGGVQVNANGTANLGWQGNVDPQLGGIGELDSRVVGPLSIGDVMTLSGSPANLIALSGAINVSAVMGPSTGTLSRVDLVVGTTVVASVTLNATNAPGAVWLRFNTADVANGSYNLTAKLFTDQSGNTPVATTSLGITIAN